MQFPALQYDVVKEIRHLLNTLLSFHFAAGGQKGPLTERDLKSGMF